MAQAVEHPDISVKARTRAESTPRLGECRIQDALHYI